MLFRDKREVVERREQTQSTMVGFSGVQERKRWRCFEYWPSFYTQFFFIYFNLIWTVLILGFVFIYNIMFVYMYTFICPLLFKANWIEFFGFLEIRQPSPFLHNLLNYELWLLLSLLRAMSLHWPPPSLPPSLSLSLSLLCLSCLFY